MSLSATIVAISLLAAAPSPSTADEAPSLFETELGPDEDRLRLFRQGGQTVIGISDPSGMGKATVKRKTPRWPVSMVVRLHLGGLESFRVGTGNIHVEWWVSSGGDNRTWIALSQGKAEVEIDRTSPYYTKLRIVGGNGKVPLRGGYFEVPIPAKLLKGNPQEITLRWIDFYRR
jgi:hypothetical protein